MLSVYPSQSQLSPWRPRSGGPDEDRALSLSALKEKPKFTMSVIICWDRCHLLIKSPREVYKCMHEVLRDRNLWSVSSPGPPAGRAFSELCVTSPWWALACWSSSHPPLWDGVKWGLFFSFFFVFFIMWIHNLAFAHSLLLLFYFFFGHSLAYVTPFESLNFLSSFLVESSGWLIAWQIRHYSDLLCSCVKGTLQLNGTRHSLSMVFNLCSPKFLLLFHPVQNWALESWQGCPPNPVFRATQPRHKCPPGTCREGGGTFLSKRVPFLLSIWKKSGE